MKKIFTATCLLFLFTSALTFCHAQQYFWQKKNDFAPGIRDLSIGFSIGDKGYAGTGRGPNVTADFWEYDPSADSWTQKADVPGQGRFGAVAFSIGNLGYVGLGWTSLNSQLRDFYEYDPALNTWISKANFPGGGRYSSTAVSVGSKAYVGTGYAPYTNDWWEFDPAANSWTQKTNFPGVARQAMIGFSLNGFAYIGTGYRNGTHYSDFWKYDPGNDSWLQVASFGGGGERGCAAFVIGNDAYVGMGYDDITYTTEWYRYNDVTNLWQQVASIGGAPRYGCFSFTINNAGYCGTGSSGPLGNPVRTADFYKFQPCDYNAVLTALGSTTICQGSFVVLQADTGQGNTYQWFKDNALINGINSTSYTAISAGNYWVTIVKPTGCISTSNSIVITSGNIISTINGSTGFCRSSTNNIYSVTPVQSGVTYNWTFPPGATIVSGQGTSSVNVSFSSTAVAGTISVLASNGCGNASASKAIVLRSSNPSTPGTITGSNVGCPNDSKLFTIKKIANADYYIWTPPNGATINGSSVAFTTPDTGVVVVYGPSFTGDSLRVKSGNCRGISAERKLRINKTNPSTPGTISGLNAGLCNLSGSIYSINAVNNATSYTWRTNIAGVTINGNVSPVSTTTTSATINFGTFTTGQIYVKANNGCGSSAERSLTVNAKPAAPVSITGPTALCTNQSGINYSTAAVNNASSYNWTVPSGCTITSGQGTTAMVMTARSTPASGTVRVRSQNSCASSAYLSKSITISTCPRLENGELIIDKIYTDVYPNPASDVFHIAIISNEESSARIILKDINGRTVKTITEQIHYGDNFYDMDVTGFADGVYILSITTDSGFTENHKVTIR